MAGKDTVWPTKTIDDAFSMVICGIAHEKRTALGYQTFHDHCEEEKALPNSIGPSLSIWFYMSSD